MVAVVLLVTNLGSGSVLGLLLLLRLSMAITFWLAVSLCLSVMAPIPILWLAPSCVPLWSCWDQSLKVVNRGLLWMLPLSSMCTTSCVAVQRRSVTHMGTYGANLSRCWTSRWASLKLSPISRMRSMFLLVEKAGHGMPIYALTNLLAWMLLLLRPLRWKVWMIGFLPGLKSWPCGWSLALSIGLLLKLLCPKGFLMAPHVLSMSCLIKLKLKVLVVMLGDGALRACVATLAVVSLKPIGLCQTWKSWLPCPVRVLVPKWGVVTLCYSYHVW